MSFFVNEVRPRLSVESVYLPRCRKLRDHGGQWRGPCPIHGGRDDSFAVNASTLEWWCHSLCQIGGGPIEFIAAADGGPDALPVSREDVGRYVRELAHVAGVASSDSVRESFIAKVREPEPEQRPPMSELLEMWRRAEPPTGWASSAFENGWGLDPARVSSPDEIRVLDGGEVPWWARCKGVWWGAAPYHVLVPLRDAGMRPLALLARALAPMEGMPKTAAPRSPNSTRGLIMANGTARRSILRGEAVEFIVREGERDWLFESQRGHATLGVRSGAWSQEHADALPTGSHVVVATDDDPTGHKYGAAIRRSLERRDGVTWAFGYGREGAPDQCSAQKFAPAMQPAFGGAVHQQGSLG